jgi:hypothetical protein
MADFEELTKLFQRLGARDPEGWASSQVNEGINQLGRFLFLREAWRGVISEDDHSWMNNEVANSERNFGKPCSGVGRALERLLAAGAEKQDISDVVRGMQYDLLFGLCYLLDDPGDLEGEVEDVYWGLVEFNENGVPIGPIAGLHESVLEMDPTGREMRPRVATND